MNWEDADLYCQDTFGTHLASIHSSSDNDDVTGDGTFWDTRSNVWIGLNDIDSEGDWVWVDGTLFNYTNGITAGYSDSTTENCVRITDSAGWGDIACTRTFTGFICNYNIGVSYNDVIFIFLFFCFCVWA